MTTPPFLSAGWLPVTRTPIRELEEIRAQHADALRDLSRAQEMRRALMAVYAAEDGSSSASTSAAVREVTLTNAAERERQALISALECVELAVGLLRMWRPEIVGAAMLRIAGPASRARRDLVELEAFYETLQFAADAALETRQRLLVTGRA